MIETLQIQGQALRVEIRPGTGTPLVLCNGWGANLETFEPLVRHLGDRPLLRFDVPGIGSSPLPRLPLRLPQLADLVERVWQHYGFRQVDVAGYSWGGMLAQELAKRNPQQLRRLVLLATAPGHLMVPASPRMLSAFANRRWLTNCLAPRRFWQRDFLCRVGPALFGGQVLRRNPMALIPLLQLLQPPSISVLWWQVAGAFGWSSLPWLWRVRQPSLIIAGRHDRAVNALNPMLMRQLMPNAHLRWIDGGHLFPVLDAPRATARIMTAFLDEHPKVVPLASRRKQWARRTG